MDVKTDKSAILFWKEQERKRMEEERKKLEEIESTEQGFSPGLQTRKAHVKSPKITRDAYPQEIISPRSTSPTNDYSPPSPSSPMNILTPIDSDPAVEDDSLSRPRTNSVGKQTVFDFWKSKDLSVLDSGAYRREFHSETRSPGGTRATGTIRPRPLNLVFSSSGGDVGVGRGRGRGNFRGQQLQRNNSNGSLNGNSPTTHILITKRVVSTNRLRYDTPPISPRARTTTTVTYTTETQEISIPNRPPTPQHIQQLNMKLAKMPLDFSPTLTSNIDSNNEKSHEPTGDDHHNFSREDSSSTPEKFETASSAQQQEMPQQADSVSDDSDEFNSNEPLPSLDLDGEDDLPSSLVNSINAQQQREQEQQQLQLQQQQQQEEEEEEEEEESIIETLEKQVADEMTQQLEEHQPVEGINFLNIPARRASSRYPITLSFSTSWPPPELNLSPRLPSGPSRASISIEEQHSHSHNENETEQLQSTQSTTSLPPAFPLSPSFMSTMKSKRERYRRHKKTKSLEEEDKEVREKKSYTNPLPASKVEEEESDHKVREKKEKKTKKHSNSHHNTGLTTHSEASTPRRHRERNHETEHHDHTEPPLSPKEKRERRKHHRNNSVENEEALDDGKRKEGKHKDKLKERKKSHRGKKTPKGDADPIIIETVIQAVTLKETLSADVLGAAEADQNGDESQERRAIDTNETFPFSNPPVFRPGRIFGVELEVLMPDPREIPSFVTALISRLSSSDVVDVPYLFFDTEKLPGVKALRSLIESGTVDIGLEGDVRGEELEVVRDIRHVAGLLKLFLQELPQPVISSFLYTHLMDIQEIEYPSVYHTTLQSLLWSLTYRDRNLLIELVKFFRSKYMRTPGEPSRVVAQQLSSAFGYIVMRFNEAYGFGPVVSTGVGYEEYHRLLQREVFRGIVEMYSTLFENLDYGELRYGVRNGSLWLVAATPEKVLERMIDVYYPEGPSYTKMMLATHTLFMKPNRVLEYLITLYHGYKNEPVRKWKAMRRDRIVEVVKLWLELSVVELREHKKFISTLCKEFPMLEPFCEVSNNNNNNNNNAASKDSNQNSTGSSKPPKKSRLKPLSLVSGRSRSVSFTDVIGNSFQVLEHHPLELAHQSIVVDHDFFMAIRLRDWVQSCAIVGSSEREARDNDTFNLSQWIAYSQKYSAWVAYEIVKEPALARRALVVGQLVAVASICKNLNDCNICCCILTGLQLPPVVRLESTWKAVHPEAMEEYQSLLKWFKEYQSMNELRTLEGFSGPTVPYYAKVELILQPLSLIPTLFSPDSKDLTHQTGTNTGFIAGFNSNASRPSSPPLSSDTSGLVVDVDKLRRVYHVTEILGKLQQSAYSIKPFPRLYIFFQQLNPAPVERLHSLSLKHEPPGGVAQQTPSQTSSKTQTQNTNNSNSNSGNSSMGNLANYVPPTYVPPKVDINWKADILRVWNKPLDQLPIGIDLPRLVGSITVIDSSKGAVLFSPTPNTPLNLSSPRDSSNSVSISTPTPTSAHSSTSNSASNIPTPTQNTTNNNNNTNTNTTEPPQISNVELPISPPTNTLQTSEEPLSMPLSPRALSPLRNYSHKVEDILSILSSITTMIESEDVLLKLQEKYYNYLSLEGDPNRDFSRDIFLLLSEVFGKENRVVKVLKACNQAIIAPAVIELTLNVCQPRLLFQDAGGWRMVVELEEDGEKVSIRHHKRQKNRFPKKEEEFEFEWMLRMTFGKNLEQLLDVGLSVVELSFGQYVPLSKKTEVKEVLSPLLSQDLQEKLNQEFAESSGNL